MDNRGIEIHENALVLESEDQIFLKIYSNDVSLETLLHDASEIECFSDCSGCKVLHAYHGGNEYCHMGWQPGMRFTWCDKSTGEVVFDRYYEQWDH